MMPHETPAISRSPALRDTNAVSSVTVRRIIRQVGVKNGKRLATLNARDLRRSFAEHAISRGWSISDLKRHLRRTAVRDASVPLDSPKQWQAKLAKPS